MAFSPDLKHVLSQDRKEVYPASQDTFLMIDALLGDLDFIKALKPTIVVEIGVGSGAVLASLGVHLESCYLVGVDINHKASLLASRTAAANSVSLVDFVTTSVFANINFKGKVDVIVCNPPYVVTPEEEYKEAQLKKDISSSYAGGTRGREFIDQLLPVANEMLSDSGVMYLLYEEANGHLEGLKLLERREGCEALTVIRKSKFNNEE